MAKEEKRPHLHRQPRYQCTTCFHKFIKITTQGVLGTPVPAPIDTCPNCGGKAMVQLQLTRGEHVTRHKQLHAMLDELLADWADMTGTLVSEAKVIDLMTWSHEQTRNPTEKGERLPPPPRPFRVCYQCKQRSPGRPINAAWNCPVCGASQLTTTVKPVDLNQPIGPSGDFTVAAIPQAEPVATLTNTDSLPSPSGICTYCSGPRSQCDPFTCRE